MKKILIILPIIYLSTGCTHYKVGVNGFTPTGTTLQIPQYSSVYVVKDSNAPNPIFEKEIAEKIQKFLNSRGHSVAAYDKANFYLLFQYAIDSGRTKTGVMPVYQPGGTATMNTFSSYGGMSYSTIQTPGYTTYVPYTKTTYTRWLTLNLIDGTAYRESKKVEPLWIGEVTSSGSCSDLREVINYMLIAAFEHFGENTKKRVTETLLSSDKRAKLLTEP